MWYIKVRCSLSCPTPHGVTPLADANAPSWLPGLAHCAIVASAACGAGSYAKLNRQGAQFGFADAHESYLPVALAPTIGSMFHGPATRAQAWIASRYSCSLR